MSKEVFVKIKSNSSLTEYIYSNLTGVVYDCELLNIANHVFLDEQSRKILRKRNREECEKFREDPWIHIENLIINPKRIRGLANE